MKIFIAVPTFESIYPETYKSIYGLQNAGHYLVFDFVRGYDCATARNRIAQQTLDEGADYVLMVDNDIVLPSDALSYLLNDPKDVCIGIYANRETDNVYNGNVCAYELGEFNYVTKFTANDINKKRSNGEFKFQIHGGGMGCALIKADVFRKLKFPWFDWVNYENSSVLSEDLYFCEQCNQNGINVYADSRVNCGHIFRHVQWPV